MSGIPDQRTYLPNQANVRSNAGINTQEAIRRRKRVGGSLFGGDVTGEHIFDAGYGEIALRKRHRGTASHYFGGARPTNYVTCITVLNGAGDEAHGKQAFLEQWQYIGLVATQGKLNRTGGFAPDVFPVDQHGTTTTTNNGDKIINSGDYVMWDVPKDAEEARMMMTKVDGMPDGRLLPYFRPYHPIRDSFSRDRMLHLRDMIVAPTRDTAQDIGVRTYVGMMDRLREIMALGALMHEYMRGASGNPSAQGFSQVPEATVLRILQDFDVVKKNTSVKSSRFVSDILHSMLAFKPEEGDYHFTGSGLGALKVTDMMKNWTHHMAEHFKQLDWEIKSRVIGQALSTANVGQKFDIFLVQPPV